MKLSITNMTTTQIKRRTMITKPKQQKTSLAVALGLGLSLMSGLSQAFDSGSTGADGAFNPTENTQLQLPSDGVFNFTTVNIPAGVTVTFQKNITNTPVTILASGDVLIDGTIDVSGGDSPDIGSAGDGDLTDDGLAGIGGPGGYDGGLGGLGGEFFVDRNGGAGLGPGGGEAGFEPGDGGFALYAGVYGSPTLLPLIGGSGGGGGSGNILSGSGGGGGGGAILIASTTTLTISDTGLIKADGGASGIASGASVGLEGGFGSGGGVRIVATTVAGNGSIRAGHATDSHDLPGRIRIEAEHLFRTAHTDPEFSFSPTPGNVFVAGLPTLSITTVAGVSAPTSPTGNADIVLPKTTLNPVAVGFSTTGVPVGSTVALKITPARMPSSGVESTTVMSSALSGTEASATASASIDIPDGPSVLSATMTYTVTIAMQDDFMKYTNGERVAQIRLDTTPGGLSMTTFITPEGKEYTQPSNTIAVN